MTRVCPACTERSSTTISVADDGALHQRNVTVFADGEVDRSPCGSGTAGRVAQLVADGQLDVGDDADPRLDHRHDVSGASRRAVGRARSSCDRAGGRGHGISDRRAPLRARSRGSTRHRVRAALTWAPRPLLFGCVVSDPPLPFVRAAVRRRRRRPRGGCASPPRAPCDDAAGTGRRGCRARCGHRWPSR